MDKELKNELKKEFKTEIEQLHKTTKALQQAVISLKKTGINEDILAYIIQQSAKKFYVGTPISLRLIRFIIQGIENIEDYLFPKENL